MNLFLGWQMSNPCQVMEVLFFIIKGPRYEADFSSMALFLKMNPNGTFDKKKLSQWWMFRVLNSRQLVLVTDDIVGAKKYAIG